MAAPERTLVSILRRDTLDIERTECTEECESVASIIRDGEQAGPDPRESYLALASGGKRDCVRQGINGGRAILFVRNEHFSGIFM